MNEQKDGICPLCGADIEYEGTYDHDDDGATLDWTCPGCGASGKAGYTFVFDQHYNVQDADGNEVNDDDSMATKPDKDEDPGMLTEQEKEVFRQLFSKYCRQEGNLNHCNADGCELCPVNQAYNEIFHKFNTDEDNDDEQEE